MGDEFNALSECRALRAIAALVCEDFAEIWGLRMLHPAVEPSRTDCPRRLNERGQA
jgi:hypothetical protein